ncbi:zinc-binding domain-containing protein [Immersiella caudata]|uniref:Zinc-binding domain-containing protein n=1 Tax=Immersiella caudata TaxID=314043 RepID=A0AA39XCQ1_9PEZI|nr:zinc-binding domain-containing protein [Immersiella caudata]
MDKLEVYTYPSLHQRVLDALDGAVSPTPHFNEVEDDGTSTNEKDTNIMGRFQCSDQNCSQPGWGSKIVAIRIRRFDDGSYNAGVYGQRCKRCNKLGVLTVDEQSYVDRVSFRLKKWAGVYVEEPHYRKRDDRAPHKKELCEGCKRGHCRQSLSYSYGYV